MTSKFQVKGEGDSIVVTGTSLEETLPQQLSRYGHAIEIVTDTQIRDAAAIDTARALEAVPGLFIGCLVANLLSPYGVLDIVFGSLATLLAAMWTRRCRSRWTAPLPPVICNAVIVGGLIAYYEAGFSAAFPAAFAYNAFTVGLGEALACYVLGLLLLKAVEKFRR